jgi:adenylate cyclase
VNARGGTDQHRERRIIDLDRRACNWPTVCFENAFPSIKLSAGEDSAIDSAFERALSGEMAASELLRIRVVAATLGVLLVADQLLLLFARDLVEQFYQKPIPAWVPTRIIGPFLAYEIVALLVLHYRLARGNAVPTAARFANALIETSLPTVSLRWVNTFTTPAVAFGTWPTMLYFIFIVASTLRLDFGFPHSRVRSQRPAIWG